MAGKYWEERGEQDRQRTSRRESNSGHRERSCVVCQRTNHKAIGADLVLSLRKDCLVKTEIQLMYIPHEIKSLLS